MESIEHLGRPSPLPAKLRWRPYANGSTQKSKRTKKDDVSQLHQQQSKEKSIQGTELNVKALVHKVRANPHCQGQLHPLPAVQLQWEEAETVESMSHGGLPHNQLHHYRRQHSQSQHKGDGDSTASPAQAPPSSSASPASRLSTLNDDSDLGSYKASVPGLTGEDFLRLGLPLPEFKDNTTYHVALNALLENHRKNKLLDAQAPALALTSVPVPISISSPATLSERTLNHAQLPINNSQRRLSTSELLGITNIDELLTSYGFLGTNAVSTKAGTNMLASPPSSEKSLHSSPVNATIDSPIGTLLSPLDITSESFDKLLAQTPVLLVESDCKQLLQQQQQQQQQQQHQSQEHLDTSPTLSMANVLSSAFTDFLQDLASPFKRTNGDPLVNGISGNDSSSWLSLFPGTSDEQSTSVGAGQVGRLDESARPLSPPLSQSSSSSSPIMNLGPIQDEEDPEWLSFLDEASPLVSTEIESADPPTGPSFLDKGLRGWAEEYLKSSAMAPTGYSSVTKTGSMSAPATTGGFIRGLSAGQKHASKPHTAASPVKSASSASLRKKSPTTVSRSSQEPSKQPKMHVQLRHRPDASSDKKDEKGSQETENLGGLLALFKGLWN
ncbi:hypothetical protein B0O80DRAFT_434208 [Mortierella sp. GBAus27b]|nr:hypothetical protein BGX31_011186 [Mortierella sp. GBA43]KAI8363648.1 hypothetical protein B0O80DRAFT_434208 [Mortierella sp. GBAus27b]